jgi:serine/threonine-protein kinase HipA
MDIIALDVRLDDFEDPVGNLVRDEDGALAFAYQSSYLKEPAAIPLSLSFPLTDEAYIERGGGVAAWVLSRRRDIA